MIPRGFRPLDRIPSIKWKLSILVIGAVIISSVVSYLGYRLGWDIKVRPIVAIGIGLAVMRVFAFGVTSPLRSMADATEAMARGDYSARVTATSRDEVGQLALAFNEMAAKLDEVDRQRRELVANASHELRTPIAALSAMIENLDDGVAEASPDYVATMHAQVRRLAHLVDQLLSLSRLDSGETALHRERVELGPLLDEVADEARWRHPEVEIEARRPVEGLTVDVDNMLMHQVLSNLVENAIRHGAPPVSLCATTTGSSVYLEVADCGRGIPPADAERVFERFHRLDQARSTAGSGLGLSIVAGIVARHGGTIRAEPNSPNGTRMIVELPSGGTE